MTELPLIFVGGLLGSAHCVGMCGPLALALGANQMTLRTNLRRQLFFSAGRVFTYGFCGGVAAFSGWWLARRPLAFVNVQATLSIIAGVALVFLGLSAAGLLPSRFQLGTASQPCSAARGLKTLLTGPGLLSALLAGVFTGFIPCGLVYAFLAYAASTGNVLAGWLTMVAFGLGTMPMMILAGSGGSLLTLTARNRAIRIAAWCVVVTGVITIARGAGYIEWLNGFRTPGCPYCQQ
jgi:sulfite exporter TauE/SafE